MRETALGHKAFASVMRPRCVTILRQIGYGPRPACMVDTYARDVWAGRGIADSC